MSREYVHICDRCDREIRNLNERAPEDWRFFNGLTSISGWNGLLCSVCVMSYQEWWDAGGKLAAKGKAKK